MAKAPKQNIALIGFMAVGKSAVGRNLAKRLQRRFVDLDRLIEKIEGKKVREIFAEKGESFFVNWKSVHSRRPCERMAKCSPPAAG